jgi:hypothetical protein
VNPEGPGGPAWTLSGPYLGEVTVENYRHTSAETAAVYFYPNGGRVVVRSDGRQNDRLPRIRRPNAIIRVALGRHHTRAQEQFPAAGGGRFFRADIDVVWEVLDPVVVAERQLRDVRILLPGLIHRLVGITARHHISDLYGAGSEIDRFLESSARQSIGADYGLDASVYVRLGLDEDEIKGIVDLDGDAARARLEEARRARLMTTLAGGDLERAAAMTAADPANLASAISMLTDADRSNRHEMVQFFQYLVNTGTVSRGQLSEQAQAVLGWVRNGGDPSVPLSVGWDQAIAPPRTRRGIDGPERRPEALPRAGGHQDGPYAAADDGPGARRAPAHPAGRAPVAGRGGPPWRPADRRGWDDEPDDLRVPVPEDEERQVRVATTRPPDPYGDEDRVRAPSRRMDRAPEPEPEPGPVTRRVLGDDWADEDPPGDDDDELDRW